MMATCFEVPTAKNLDSPAISIAHHQRYWDTHFMPHRPGESRTKAQTNAEPQFATWKLSHGISAMPAAIGTVARKGPEKRAITMPAAPQRLKKARALSSRRGWLFR